MHRGLKWLSVATAIGMYVVLIAGSLVTNTGSGEGCGASWPLCHGQWMPPLTLIATAIELNHRLVTGVVGLLIFAQAFWTWRVLPAIAAVRVLVVTSIVLLLWQSWLGAAAVMWGAASAVLASHFGFSLVGPVGIHMAHRIAAGSLVLLTAWFAYLTWQTRRHQPAVYLGSLAALGLVLLQATVGAFVVLTHMELLWPQMLQSAIVSLYFGVLTYLSLLAFTDAAPAGFRARAVVA